MRFDQLSSQSTRAATGCAIALGFSIPVSVALDNTLLAAVLLCWLAAAGFREKFALLRKQRVAQAALVLFGLLALGIAWSGEAAEGLRLLGKYIDLIFIAIFVTLFRAERNRKLAGAFLIAALLTTLLLSYLTWAGMVAQGHPVIGNADEPEVFKKYLTQSILIACGAYLFALLARAAATRNARLLWALLSIAAIVNVCLMLSGRSGQITLAALSMLFVYSVWRYKGLALIAGILVLATALVVGGYAPESNRFATAIKDFKSWQPGKGMRTSTSQRIDYSLNSLAIVRNHPLFGVGTGGFAAAYAQQVEGSNLEATVNPHNEYLNIAVQLGLVGLLALCWLFAMVWRHSRALPTALERDLARGLALTFAVGCLFNSMLMDHVEGLFFAWGVGVLFGGYDPARMRIDTPKQ
jgi:O-antigen ligase